MLQLLRSRPWSLGQRWLRIILSGRDLLWQMGCSSRATQGFEDEYTLQTLQHWISSWHIMAEIN